MARPPNHSTAPVTPLPLAPTAPVGTPLSPPSDSLQPKLPSQDPTASGGISGPPPVDPLQPTVPSVVAAIGATLANFEESCLLPTLLPPSSPEPPNPYNPAVQVETSPPSTPPNQPEPSKPKNPTAQVETFALDSKKLCCPEDRLCPRCMVCDGCDSGCSEEYYLNRAWNGEDDTISVICPRCLSVPSRPSHNKDRQKGPLAGAIYPTGLCFPKYPDWERWRCGSIDTTKVFWCGGRPVAFGSPPPPLFPFPPPGPLP